MIGGNVRRVNVRSEWSLFDFEGGYKREARELDSCYMGFAC